MFEDVPSRRCSPRHRLLYDSTKYEGSHQISMTWRAVTVQPSAAAAATFAARLLAALAALWISLSVVTDA